MLAINKISIKSIKYDTKLYTYDKEYDTKPSIRMIIYAISFTYYPK